MGGVLQQKPEPPGSATPDAAACRAQLARILASPDFDATERDRRFLSYVVEESLAGRADRIKAYSIAIEVFGRDPSFDPQSDPIVRVEAGHLRRALDRYYLTAGRDDAVAISVPKGGYAPSFGLRAADAEPAAPDPAAAGAAATAGPRRRVLPALAAVLALLVAVGLGAGLAVLVQRTEAPATPDIPRLAIEPFVSLDPSPAGGSTAAGLTAEVIAEVARFKDLVVIDGGVGPEGRVAPARYRLAGDVAMDAHALRVQVRLRRVSDGSVVWVGSYSADLAEERPLVAETRIAGDVATAIGQPYGAIYQADAGERLAHPPAAGDAYACTQSYFAFRASLDAGGYAATRSCLEAAVARFPDYATAWALLAESRIDGLRFGFAPGESLATALDEARHALVLDPLNVRALQAKMLALYLSGELEAATRVGEMALAINPNDTELMSEYGYRLALSGHWDRGCPLVAEARERNPGPLAYYETALALCAYMAGDYAGAASWIKAAPFPAVPIYHLVAAGVLAEAGQVAEARAEVAWLRANDPDLVSNVRVTVAPRVGRPEDFERFAVSLRKAGLDVPD